MKKRREHDDRPDPAKRLEKARLRKGIKTAAEAALRFGWRYATYAQHENGERGLARSAKKYAAAYGVSEAWLLTGEGESPPPPKVPVLGIVAGSITGWNIIHEAALDWVRRPPSLEGVNEAYACWVRGTSMEPAFREGSLIFVHPYKPPQPGDHVVIQQNGPLGEPVAFIKELVRHQGDVVAKQYNPTATITYPANTVIAVHKVLTTGELFAN